MVLRSVPLLVTADRENRGQKCYRYRSNPKPYPHTCLVVPYSTIVCARLIAGIEDREFPSNLSGMSASRMFIGLEVRLRGRLVS